MPSLKLFWADPYLDRLSSTVASCERDRISLDKTIFFAFSGGQASDSGAIGGFPVFGAELRGREIFYTLPDDHTLRTGDTVETVIDLEKRLRIMRLHFAAEIILELVNRNFARPERIGANITERSARLDFIWTGSIADTFGILHEKAKELISLNLSIISDYSDREREIRFWEIQGFAKVPCTGTHPKTTGEVGGIGLKRVHLGKNKERIEIRILD
jgi:Ser-tRNA(Ala) deacylase AlaX